MILYPAIDLKDGACVRLIRGDMGRATTFNADPVDQALRFQAMGFDWLHIVDLNGAFAGHSVNGAAVAAILAAVPLKIQLGGGLRDLAAIEAWLARGVTRVILGTAAVKSPDLVRRAARQFPGRIAVGIDARDGMVAVEGWAEHSSLATDELALRLADFGIAAIIHTDIARDGVMAGLNIEASEHLARLIDIPIIVSGGLAGLEDVRALRAAARRTPGLNGAIAGRALYDGRLDVAAALELCAA